MKKLIILRGLPGSGKSTYAKQLLKEKTNTYKRINRDSLRAMFDDNYNSKGNEKFIKKMRDVLIIEALKAGKHVIVDDTNLSEKHITRFKQMAQQYQKETGEQIEVIIKEMETSLSECIERDKKRERTVGERVIRSMQRTFAKDKDRYAVQETSLPKAIICDLDGTLALMNGRNPFAAEHCEADKLNVPVANVVFRYKELGYKILLLSGRSDAFQEQTLNWLKQHKIPYDALWMRPAADRRKDSIFKRELYETNIENKYFVEFILDDRNQVVNMWRDDLKLPCFQVYYGDF